ncbi:hypothetical protein FDUTEX481_02593 [Tolypothrix sp. PCC 7601]|nr:hypothetical protein FDUTEX481_02593 [Tolypothrix sp. PCC 7601]
MRRFESSYLPAPSPAERLRQRGGNRQEGTEEKSSPDLGFKPSGIVGEIILVSRLLVETPTPVLSSRASRLRGFPPLCGLAWETRPRDWLPLVGGLVLRVARCLFPVPYSLFPFIN